MALALSGMALVGGELTVLRVYLSRPAPHVSTNCLLQSTDCRKQNLQVIYIGQLIYIVQDADLMEQLVGLTPAYFIAMLVVGYKALSYTLPKVFEGIKEANVCPHCTID